MESHRKPYIRKVSATWWLKNKTYRKYMIREASALFHLWIGVELAIVAVAAVVCDAPADWIAAFVQSPVVIGLNIITVPFTIIHIYTWYQIFPKGVRVFRSGRPEETRLVPEMWITAAGYAITIGATCLILWALFCA